MSEIQTTLALILCGTLSCSQDCLLFYSCEMVSIAVKFDVFHTYQLLHEYHRILAVCNMKRNELASSLLVLQISQYFVVLMQ